MHPKRNPNSGTTRRTAQRASAQEEKGRDRLELWSRRRLSSKKVAEAAATIFFKPGAPLALRTDTSDYAIDAALKQKNPHGVWGPLAFFAKKLFDTEMCHSAYDREFLASEDSRR